MYISETTVRVRYAETDKMNYVYYGNYAQYYEIGRVEALRQLGISYRSIEEQGFMLPVHTMSSKFIRPAQYDDLLIIKTTIKELPSTRIYFKYEIFNEKSELLNEGETTLVFVNMKTNRPTTAPEFILEKFKKLF